MEDSHTQISRQEIFEKFHANPRQNIQHYFQHKYVGKRSKTSQKLDFESESKSSHKVSEIATPTINSVLRIKNLPTIFQDFRKNEEKSRIKRRKKVEKWFPKLASGSKSSQK